MNFYRSKSFLVYYSSYIPLSLPYCYHIHLWAPAGFKGASSSCSSVCIIMSILCVLLSGSVSLFALMRIRQKVCFAVSISGGGPNEIWHRYSRVRSWPYHDSHYSPLFSHDDMEQIDRLKKHVVISRFKFKLSVGAYKIMCKKKSEYSTGTQTKFCLH